MNHYRAIVCLCLVLISFAKLAEARIISPDGYFFVDAEGIYEIDAVKEEEEEGLYYYEMVDSNDEIIQEGFWDVESQQRLVIEELVEVNYDVEADYEAAAPCGYAHYIWRFAAVPSIFTHSQGTSTVYEIQIGTYYGNRKPKSFCQSVSVCWSFGCQQWSEDPFKSTAKAYMVKTKQDAQLLYETLQ